MSHTVHVNEASPAQLTALLNLLPHEVDRLVAARPFASVDDLHAALPRRLAQAHESLELPKLDINRASEADLIRRLDISANVARSIQDNRPYYFMMELRHVPGVDSSIFSRVISIFTTSAYSYTNKLSGEMISLDPSSSELLLRFADIETADIDRISASLRLQPRSTRRIRNSYQVYMVPQTETGTDVLAALKRQPNVEQAVPSFETHQGLRQYLDPEFCVVQFNEGISELRQREIIAALGLEIHERHRAPGLYTLRVPGASTDPGSLFRAIAGLTHAQEVKFAEPSYLGVDDLEHPTSQPVPIIAPGSWSLALIRAPEAWTLGGIGSPDTVVAVIDTGVDGNHPSLADAILPRQPEDDWNFSSDDDPVPYDEIGHGTFIAGILVGNGRLGVQGICPGCRVLPIRVPVSGAAISYARRRDAILYALEYVPPSKRLIINLSWKTTGDIASIRDAVATAVERNVLVITSAGNWPQHMDEPHYPSDYAGMYGGVISVGGVGPDGRMAPYSFYGRNITLAAPGGAGSDDQTQNISSAGLGGGIQTDYGTSFAAPLVAGAAALMLSQNSTLSVTQIRRLLEATARPIADPGLGRGLLDVAAAVAQTRREGALVEVPEGASEHLTALNQDDLDTLVSRFGITRITARIIIARRPINRVEDIRGILGLTDEEYARIAGATCTSNSVRSAETSIVGYSDNSNRLVKLNPNVALLEEIRRVPGMPTFTARLIIARRPYTRLNSLLSITGMTPELLEFFALDA